MLCESVQHLRLHLLSIEALLPIGDDGMDSLLVPSFELAYNSLVRMELTASKLGKAFEWIHQEVGCFCSFCQRF